MSKLTMPAILALSAMIFGAHVLPVAAAEMQPGMWRFTQRTQAGGRAWARARSRCVSPAQARDPARFFMPAGQGCAIVSHTAFGSRVTSTLRCTNGPTTSDLTSTIVIDSPTHLSITTAMMTTGTKGRQAGVSLRGEGIRTGNCRGRGRG